MEINIEKYLSYNEMKEIAERIYTEKITAEVNRVIEARYAGNLVDNIMGQIVAACVLEISDKYKDDILSLCKSEITRTKSNNADWDDTVNSSINFELKKVSTTVINEHVDEIKQISYAKILECCNEIVLLAFVGDIIKKLDLDSAVKEILQYRFGKQNEKEGEKNNE